MKLFGLALIALTTTTAFAASDSGTLVLQGTVLEATEITITPTASATTLDLSASPSDLNVASVNEKTNSVTGYTVTLTSANDGELVNTPGNDSLAYTATYDGAAVSLSSTTPATITNQTTPGAYDVDKDFDISYSGKPAAEMTAGTYTDTLTFTISSI